MSYPEAFTDLERDHLRDTIWMWDSRSESDAWVVLHLRSLGIDSEDPISDLYAL